MEQSKPMTERAPRRIQRQRTKGWRMPKGAVYVGRPSRWGNPYRWDDYNVETIDGSPAPLSVRYREGTLLALRDYEGWLYLHDKREDIRRELRGKDLACWCPEGVACHADVLLRIAND